MDDLGNFEHLPYKQYVVGSNPTRAAWMFRLVVLLCFDFCRSNSFRVYLKAQFPSLFCFIFFLSSHKFSSLISLPLLSPISYLSLFSSYSHSPFNLDHLVPASRHDPVLVVRVPRTAVGRPVVARKNFHWVFSISTIPYLEATEENTET